MEAFYVIGSWLRSLFTASLVMRMLALCSYVLPDAKQCFKYFSPGSVH